MKNRGLSRVIVRCLGFGAMLALAATPAVANETPGGTGLDTHFQMMDANRDGKVSADEHAAGARKMFETMDTNKDGKVTVPEMEAAHDRLAAKKPGKDEMTAAEKIKVVDVNGDGVLTADEHAAGSASMFQKMDTDKDGFLTKTEIVAGHSQLMKKPPAKK